MGKILIALAWLFFVQDPIGTLANQVNASRLPDLGEIDAGTFNLDRVPANSMQKSGVGAWSKPVLRKSSLLPSIP